jgi:hypothetical protein
MIYGYARVSTEAQDLSSQLAPLKGAGCEKVFREKITGTTADRPQLRKLMAALAHGDVVIIPAVDRLSRDTTDLLIIAARCRRPGRAFTHWPSRSSIRPRTLPRSFLRSLALPRSWNAAASSSAPHGAVPTPRPRASNRPQACPHPSSAARSDQAARRGRRNAALDSPQLQCQPAADFEADGISTDHKCP